MLDCPLQIHTSPTRTLEKTTRLSPWITSSWGWKEAGCAGSSTFQVLSAKALVEADVPLKLTLISSSGFAHPQTHMGWSL